MQSPLEIRSLGYFRVGSSALEDWRRFGTDLLGMQVAASSSVNLDLRMDDRRQRLVIDADVPENTRCFGWEVADSAALDRVAAAVDGAGYPVRRENKALADRRFVTELISFNDPLGNRIEVFYGSMVASDPFVPGRAISGFRTGPLGLGHAVLWVENATPVVPFYRDVLGFRLSDYMTEPFSAYFFHVNSRHHSFALVEMGKNSLHHMMVEMCNLDDVGQAYDIAQNEDLVSVTLGRHTNDYITSFYAKTPSNFLFEYGWGVRSIDVDTWQPYELVDGPSLWGHDRSWLSDELRAKARDMRMAAAARGVRVPPFVPEATLDGSVSSNFTRG